MAEKNSFVLRNEYLDIFTDLSDNQAGVLIKAVYKYAAAKEMPEGLKDVEVKMAFKFIKKDIDYDTAKYEEICEKRSEAGKSGGRPKKQMLFEKPKGFFEKQKKHSDSVSDSVVVSDSEKLQLLTAADAAEQAEKSPKPKLNKLQEFSNRVIEHFEELKTDDQKAIWFKRNCRCLSDILKFCGGDIDVAVECIAVCVERLEKAGLKGGYEAVCRNLPDYYREACQRVKARVKNAQENN
ncbi:DUF6291 domain-containing protein [Candidatus Proelusimicrobium excrementi]|uniref:DUF6291 domain-containing protein n=1 Tax=Candidatus Proelusimicrobium excrementi TaxID=3416222 RepID=UPI003CA3A36A|nr:hypothetical protein [Elusimicrobiaceae bacterium]